MLLQTWRWSLFDQGSAFSAAGDTHTNEFCLTKGKNVLAKCRKYQLKAFALNGVCTFFVQRSWKTLQLTCECAFRGCGRCDWIVMFPRQISIFLHPPPSATSPEACRHVCVVCASLSTFVRGFSDRRHPIDDSIPRAWNWICSLSVGDSTVHLTLQTWRAAGLDMSRSVFWGSGVKWPSFPAVTRDDVFREFLVFGRTQAIFQGSSLWDLVVSFQVLIERFERQPEELNQRSLLRLWSPKNLDLFHDFVSSWDNGTANLKHKRNLVKKGKNILWQSQISVSDLLAL